MSEGKNYDWTGVWVLASIHIAQTDAAKDVPKAYKKMNFTEQLTKYKNLYRIIYAGDYINRAIFTNSELIDGIDRLTKMGYIEEKESFLLTTKKLKNRYEKATAKMKSVSLDTELHIFANILQTRLPWE